MENIKIIPHKLEGAVTVPPSKSAAHRMILAAALSDGESLLTPACHSADIDATLDCVKKLGAKVLEKDNAFYITGIEKKDAENKSVVLDCRESGSTLRFIIPICAALGVNATFIGSGRLPSRPIDQLCDLLKSGGVWCSSNKLPLEIKGKLKANNFKISGDISSQFLTGILLALPLIEGNPTVSLTTPLQSAGYVDMTLDALEFFGVKTEILENTYKTFGSYTAKTGVIEGDWSSACFFISAGAISGEIKISGLKTDSLQGDKSAVEIFKKFGAEITFEKGELTVTGKNLVGTRVDCSQIPDMVPSLAVTAAFAKGETTLYGAQRLRLKESDRIKTTIAGLRNMGIKADELPDGIKIYGGKPFGGRVDGANDHRIVMAFSVMGAYSENPTEIIGFNAINKSYPDFFGDFKGLGGIANVITDR